MDEMRACIKEGAPAAVTRQIIARLSKSLLPEDPSLELQREVFLQHAASVCQPRFTPDAHRSLWQVAELGGEQAANATKRPRATRSAVILSGAPAKESLASMREYADWTNSSRKSVKRHVEQRDSSRVTGGETYELIRKVPSFHCRVCMHALTFCFRSRLISTSSTTRLMGSSTGSRSQILATWVTRRLKRYTAMPAMLSKSSPSRMPGSNQAETQPRRPLGLPPEGVPASFRFIVP
jgi:hypothetical protein